MPEILIFAGTTEGRKLLEYLAGAEINHTICVATEYGEIILRQNPLVKVHQGRMNQEQIEKFLGNEKFDVVVDATHPFAKEVTCNIQAALKKMGQIGIPIPYLRLKNLASCIGESYQDAAVYSTHGKKLYNLARRIKVTKKEYSCK